MTNDTSANAAAPKRDRRSATNTAFLVESLVLLFFLVAALAVFTQVFAARLSAATEVAQNVAEEFSANPAAVASGQAVGAGIAANGSDGFNVSCDVDEQAHDEGTLYTAHIVVSDDKGKAYELDAASFQGGAQ